MLCHQKPNFKFMDKEKLKEAVENLGKNKLEGLKLEMSLKLGMMVEDEELKTKLKELMGEAIGQAFEHGRVAGMPTEQLEKMHSELKDCLGKIFQPSDASEAEKYRHLYFTQRLITDSLRTALMYAESIPLSYESDRLSSTVCLGFRELRPDKTDTEGK